MSIDAKEKTMPAGQFKQMCLGVLDDVAKTGVELVITKRNRPVARLIPITQSKVHERAVLKRLRGQGKMLVAEAVFLEPIHDAGWHVLDEE